MDQHVLKISIFVHISSVSCILANRKNPKCKVGGKVGNTFTAEPVCVDFAFINLYTLGKKFNRKAPQGFLVYVREK